MQKLKEMWQNLSAKSKKLLGIIAGITVVVIAVAVFLLARGQKTEYQTLFFLKSGRGSADCFSFAGTECPLSL